MHRRAVLLVLGLLLVGARGARAEPATVAREIQVGGTTRSYLIHVPAGWDRVLPLPVLFVFHGAGSDAESMVRATGFDALADATPAGQMLVVYPRAPARLKRYEVDTPAGRESADVLLVDALLQRLRARFPVDERRIWATGFSNGAALCYRLAAERPEVFAAIAPVAGYLPDLVRTPPVVPVPLLHVHGTADGRVGSPSLDVPSSAVRTWAGWNGAVSGPVETRFTDPSTLVLRRQVFTGPSTRSDTHLLLVEGRGHEWSGGPGGVVTRAVLEFLAAHPRESLVGKPFGSLETLRWQTADGKPPALAAKPLTLFQWWTHESADGWVRVSLLAAAAQHFRARGLGSVAVHGPAVAPLSELPARARQLLLGFDGVTAFDDRGSKYLELRQRGGLPETMDLSVLVDAQGIVRWVHSGARPGLAPLAVVEFSALLDRLLPPAATSNRTAPR